jgi:hypothetical protein
LKKLFGNEETRTSLIAGMRSSYKIKEKSIASIFFKFSHRKDGIVLPNQAQVHIVDEIKDSI